MWPYFHVAPTLWTGQTGRDWKTLGQPYQILGVYLQTSPAANPYGLYYVSRAQIADESGLTAQVIAKILGHFADTQYAFYDNDGQWCWVVNMTARQILGNDQPPKALPTSDNRIKAINKWYAGLPDNVFLGPYFDKYAPLVHLTARRIGSRQATLASTDPAALTPPEEPSLFPPATVPLPPTQDELFETWWREYPPHRRTGKKAARSEWARLKPRPAPESVAKMIAVLQIQRSSHDWIKEGGRYVPEPERYLKKGRYLDEPTDLNMPIVSAEEAQTVGTLQRWEPPRD